MLKTNIRFRRICVDFLKRLVLLIKSIGAVLSGFTAVFCYLNFFSPRLPIAPSSDRR